MAKTIPPSALLHKLETFTGRALDLLTFRGDRRDRRISLDEARVLAEHGLIHGIVTGPGILCAVAWRPANAAPDPAVRRRPGTISLAELAEAETGGSSGFARTNLGVYRQALCSVVVGLDAQDRRVVTGEGEVTAHTYAFCTLRGRGEALQGV